MIKLAFLTMSRKIIRFTIDGPKVIYYDDIWDSGVQIYPLDEKFIKELKQSKKYNLKLLAALILDSNSGKDLQEYNSCNGDENKIVEFINKDCKSKGLIKIK